MLNVICDWQYLPKIVISVPLAANPPILLNARGETYHTLVNACIIVNKLPAQLLSDMGHVILLVQKSMEFCYQFKNKSVQRSSKVNICPQI